VTQSRKEWEREGNGSHSIILKDGPSCISICLKRWTAERKKNTRALDNKRRIDLHVAIMRNPGNWAKGGEAKEINMKGVMCVRKYGTANTWSSARYVTVVSGRLKAEHKVTTRKGPITRSHRRVLLLRGSGRKYRRTGIGPWAEWRKGETRWSFFTTKCEGSVMTCLCYEKIIKQNWHIRKSWPAKK